MSGVTTDARPTMAAALAVLQVGRVLTPADVAVLRALLPPAPVTAKEARAQRLAARDEAVRAAASLLPLDTPTGLASELERRLARMAALRRPPGAPLVSDPLNTALIEVLEHNFGKPLRWRQLRKLICGLGRS